MLHDHYPCTVKGNVVFTALGEALFLSDVVTVNAVKKTAQHEQELLGLIRSSLQKTEYKMAIYVKKNE